MANFGITGWDINIKQFWIERLKVSINMLVLLRYVNSCQMGKSYKPLLQNIHVRSSKHFEIIYMDILGPSSIASTN